MLNYEFFILLAVTVLMHGATFAVAALIYFKQQAFNRAMFAAVTAAIADIKKDLHDPAVFRLIGAGIVTDIETKFKLALDGLTPTFRKIVEDLTPGLRESIMNTVSGAIGNIEKYMVKKGVKGGGPLAALQAAFSKGSIQKKIQGIAEAMQDDSKDASIEMAVGSDNVARKTQAGPGAGTTVQPTSKAGTGINPAVAMEEYAKHVIPKEVQEKLDAEARRLGLV